MVTNVYSKTALISCIIIASLSEFDSRKASRTSPSDITWKNYSIGAKTKHNVAPKTAVTKGKRKIQTVEQKETQRQIRFNNKNQNSTRRIDVNLSGLPPGRLGETLQEQMRSIMRESSKANDISKEDRIRFLATKSLSLQNVTNDKMELLINKRLTCMYERAAPAQVNTDLWNMEKWNNTTLRQKASDNKRDLNLRNRSSNSGRRKETAFGYYAKEIIDPPEKKKVHEVTKIMQLHQQWIYMAQERLKNLEGIIEKRKRSVRFRMGFIFRHLADLLYKLRMAWTFMLQYWRQPQVTDLFKDWFPDDRRPEISSFLFFWSYTVKREKGYVRMWHYLMYYSSAVRRYLDIVYLTDRLAMVFHRYYEHKKAVLQAQFATDKPSKKG